MLSDDDMPRDVPSRGDRLLDEIKRKRIRPGQFRLATLFWITSAVAVLFAIPRMLRWPYPMFFQFLYLFAFLLAPLVALVVASFFPWLRRRNRILLAAVSLAATMLPVPIVAAFVGAAREIPMFLIVISFFFWLPQTVCIWGVWYFLFRKPRPKNNRRRAINGSTDTLPQAVLPADDAHSANVCVWREQQEDRVSRSPKNKTTLPGAGYGE